MADVAQTRRLRSGADTGVLSTKGKLDELMARTYALDDTEKALQDLKLDDAGRGVLLMDS